MRLCYRSLLPSFVLLFLITFSIPCQAEPSSTFKADLQSKRIAAGTPLEIRFLEDLNSITNYSGDYFTACLENDIKLNKRIVLPSGTFMRGTVGNVRKSKRLKRPAEMYLNFDHLVTPDGRQLDVSLRLTDITLTKDGFGLSGGGNYRTSVRENFDDSVEFVRSSVNWGNEMGDRFLWGYPKLVITPVTATGGFFSSAFMFSGKSFVDLFKKGNDVILHQNQVVKGTLTEPIDLPLY